MFTTPAQQAENKITSFPAPIGGLNARDSLAAMPELDAVILQDFWPQPYGVSVRRGWQKWVSIPSGTQVDTLAVWFSTAGTQKLFAWAGTKLWDVTVRGTVLGTPLVSSLSNAIWQHVSMSNAAGAHLIAVNGIDDGIVYNSSGINRLTLGDGIVAYTWFGLDPKVAIQLTIHQHRLWAVEKNSSKGYYLAPDAIYGTLASFDFGPAFPAGGYLSFLATWTMDDGSGSRDLLVAVSSTGYAVVYGGTDPDDSTKWSQEGVYYIGAPVKGRRSYTKVGGDLFILTQQGIVSMAGLVASTTVNDTKQSFPSDKIQYLLSQLIGDFGDLANWQLEYVPKINMLICNVPSVTEGGNIQLVSNQITNAWAQFTNMDATTWTVFADQPFFGTYNGYVCIAWEGFLDDVELDASGGDSIKAVAQQAFSYLGSPGAQKQVGMYRPNFVAGASVIFNTAIVYDFNTKGLEPPDQGTPSGAGARWDAALWDAALWAGATERQRNWIQGEGFGTAVSIAIAATAAKQEALWVSTDYSYRVGTLL